MIGEADGHRPETVKLQLRTKLFRLYLGGIGIRRFGLVGSAPVTAMQNALSRPMRTIIRPVVFGCRKAKGRPAAVLFASAKGLRP